MTKYLILVVPAVLFLIVTAYRIKQIQGSSIIDACHPLVIGLGLILMHYGRSLPDVMWSVVFWIGACVVLIYLLYLSILMCFKSNNSDVVYSLYYLLMTGESLVATMFTYNSLPPQKTPTAFVAILVGMLILTLWLRGDLWKYLTLVALEVILAILLALIFPIMEMLLEAILNEKLKKVGEKVRAQNVRMEAYYKAKQ